MSCIQIDYKWEDITVRTGHAPAEDKYNQITEDL